MPIATQHLAGGGSINVYASEDDKIYAHSIADGRLCRNVEPEQLRQYVDQPTHIEAMHAVPLENRIWLLTWASLDC